jgi:DNA-binding transcriptional regulator YhcF (GntR family)
MSLQNDIYRKLIEAIASGELGPGEKLSEIELAKEMRHVNFVEKVLVGFLKENIGF